jgi:ribosomal protein L6P/L9E
LLLKSVAIVHQPYKGKGVRYADENVRRKEAKKK